MSLRRHHPCRRTQSTTDLPSRKPSTDHESESADGGRSGLPRTRNDWLQQKFCRSERGQARGTDVERRGFAGAGSSAPAGSEPASSAPAGSAPPKGEAGLLAYSQCMRAHGVPDFPDPVGNSLQLKASQGSDLDPTSPQNIAAQKACKSLQPAGPPGGKVDAAQQANALKYSACMRDNGVPNFPDPVFSDGGVQLKITNIDPNSPQFVAAQKACQSLQPIGGQTSNGGP